MGATTKTRIKQLPFANFAKRKGPLTQNEKTIQEDRLFVARKLKRTRANDRNNSWQVYSSSLARVSTNLEYDIEAGCREILHRKKRCRVLDVGCHDGRAIRELKSKVEGIEAHGLSLARLPSWGEAKKKVKFHVGTIEGNRFKPNYFDFMYAHSSMIHAHDKAKALNEIHRMLSPGGIVVLHIETTMFFREKVNALFDDLTTRKQMLSGTLVLRKNP
jgi:SAM-dependent methyltransferase